MKTCGTGAVLLAALFLFSSSAAAQTIHEAAGEGDDAAVRALLSQNNSLVDSRDDQECTPLHHAAVRGHTDLVALLVDAGADVDAQNHSGETPLHWAVIRNRKGAVEVLIRRGAETELREDYGRTPLLWVARETGNAEVAAVLIGGGADVMARDRYGDTPLNLAAWRGFADVIDLLLEAGAEVPTAGQTAHDLTMFSAERGLGRLFGMLAEGGADLSVRSATGGSLLHPASEGGSGEIVEILLEKGLDVNERDNYGLTPLHYAAEKGRNEAAETLIDSGADLEARSLAGDTPLNLAARYERDSTVALLRARGASPEPPAFPLLEGPYFGQTPPGSDAVLFAPEIVSSHRFEHGTVAFSPDGDEALWGSAYPITTTGYGTGIMMTSSLEDGRWTPPHKAAFSELGHGDDVPFFAPDGSRLFFISSRPIDGAGRAERIWYMDRTEHGWSEPRPIEGGPNTQDLHWLFSVAASGNLYFGSGAAGGHGMGDIYVSRFVDDRYADPENLGDVINTEHSEGSPYIAPDESYLIFQTSGRPDVIGGPDLFIAFKDGDGNWTQPVNMGEPVNSRSSEICPMVSPDGKYFFWNSFRNGSADNYWIDAKIIAELRAEALQ